MDELRLWANESEKIADFVNELTTVEKLELVVALSEDVLNEVKSCDTLKNDETKEMVALLKTVKQITKAGDKVDFMESLNIEQANKACEDMKEMQERGFMFAF